MRGKSCRGRAKFDRPTGATETSLPVDERAELRRTRSGIRAPAKTSLPFKGRAGVGMGY
jgi:hypothetical protein